MAPGSSWVAGVLSALLLVLPWSAGGQQVKVRTSQIWPMPVMQVQVELGPLQEGDTEEARRERLAAVGEEGFRKYVTDYLPKELDASPAFKAEYENEDFSRDNIAFTRWQREVFAAVTGMVVDDHNWGLNYEGPTVEGVEHKWPEFYQAGDSKAMSKTLSHYARGFLKHIHWEGHGRWKFFFWAEVYGPGHFHRPRGHPSSPVAGMWVARHSAGERNGQTFIIEDPRGMNPPFGHRHEIAPVEGELTLFPAWASHYLTPNTGNDTNVYFFFQGWQGGGLTEFDWEDDPAGSFVRQFTRTIGENAPKAKKDEL